MLGRKFQAIIIMCCSMVVISWQAALSQSMNMEPTEELRFGFYGGANYNLVGAGAVNLTRISNGTNFVEPQLNDGSGIAPYFGAIGEYNSGEVLGAALRLSVDFRNAEMEDDQGRKFAVNMSYVTIEPGMRFNLGMPEFSFSAGPALAVNLAAKYDYEPSSSDEIDENIEDKTLSGVNNVAFGIWGDLGYDINLSDEDAASRWYLSPFLGVSWITDQKKTDFPELQDERDDVWSTVSIRGGVQVKFGAVQ